MKSRSDAQLHGADIDVGKAESCAPQQYLDGDLSLPITPCGLIAWSYFNDTFEVNLLHLSCPCMPLIELTQCQTQLITGLGLPNGGSCTGAKDQAVPPPRIRSAFLIKGLHGQVTLQTSMGLKVHRISTLLALTVLGEVLFMAKSMRMSGSWSGCALLHCRTSANFGVS